MWHKIMEMNQKRMIVMRENSYLIEYVTRITEDILLGLLHNLSILSK